MIAEVGLVTAIIIITLLYLTGNYNENYWKKRGVTFHPKNKVMGPFWDFITKDRSLFLLFDDLYKQYPDEPAVAFGSFLTPALYVKDITNIQHVMLKDFHSFSHRALAFNENDTLALNIAFVHGPRWKLLRQSITPLFTGAKLKNMFYIIDRSAQDFVNFLKTNPMKLKENTYEAFNTYSYAVLAAFVFGIEAESTFGSPLLKVVKKALTPTFWSNLKFSMSSFCTSLFKAMDMTLFSVEEDFFVAAIKQVIRKREKENMKRHDFVDLCINLQKNGKMRDSDTGFELEPTDELLAAQAFVFFLAGIEPCSSSIFNILMELGRNPSMLQHVHEEVDGIFEKLNDHITYDAVLELEFLDKVVNEALRMYPSVAFVTRECVQDSTLPVGNIRVDKGTKIFTPIYELHRDPNFFSDPHVFDPERFSVEGRQRVNDTVLMPFGIGSRMCIASRYAMLQIKTGVLHVLRHFTVKTIVKEGGVKYKKEQFLVRLNNISLEFIARK